jgi:hypothetical protein
VELAVQTLLGLDRSWRDHRDDCLMQVALSELVRGELAQARKIADHVSENGRWRLAKLAFHCAMRPGAEHRQQAEDYVVQLTSWLPQLHEYHLCFVHTFLAGAYHGLGWSTEVGVHLEKALQTCKPQSNHGEQSWPLLTLMVCLGRGGGWAERAVHWKLPPLSFHAREPLQVLVWYSDLDTLLAFKREGAAHQVLDEHALIDPIAQKAPLDRLEECVEAFASPYYGRRLVATALEAAEQASDPGLERALIRWLREPAEEACAQRLRWLGVASRSLPELARSVLAARPWALEDRPQSYHDFGGILGRLGMWDTVQAELDSLRPDRGAALLVGAAGQLAPDACDARLHEAAARMQDGDADSWFLLAAASARAGSPSKETWRREVIRRFLGMEHHQEDLLTRLTEAGDLQGAYRTWMKIPAGTRKYRLRPLLAAARRARHHDALYDLLVSLEPKDLNDRGQHAVSVLNGLTGCGEDRI